MDETPIGRPHTEEEKKHLSKLAKKRKRDKEGHFVKEKAKPKTKPKKKKKK